MIFSVAGRGGAISSHIPPLLLIWNIAKVAKTIRYIYIVKMVFMYIHITFQLSTMVHYVHILYRGIASIALGSVTMASLRNMGQTFFITTTSSTSTCGTRQQQRQKNHHHHHHLTIQNQHYDPKNNKYNALWKAMPNDNVQSHNDQDVLISHLKQMSRKELLELYLRCEPPNHLDDILGSWDGVLLSNNLVLTSVSQFITHGLFGKGSKWNGKSFYCNNHNKRKEYTGTNRFQTTTVDGAGSIGNNDNSLDERHKFDYSYSKSRIQPHQTSILLDYQRYQHFLSPWKTMKDEIRVLRPARHTSTTPHGSTNRRGRRKRRKSMEPALLIGLGSMGWSGGKWNCQPFCLVQVLD